MDKKKKIMIITIIAIILILITAGVIYFVTNKNGKEITTEEVSKLNQYYEKIKNTNSYTFITTLDDKNNNRYSKQDKKAYINSNYKGKT